MKKIYILSFTALLLFGAAGCSKDFLDVQPTAFLTAEQVQEASVHNPDVVAGSISGIYTLMFETGTGGTTGHDDFGQKGYDIYSDFLSADLALSTSTYGWYRTITEFQTTQDYTYTDNYQVWRYYYRIIRSANSVIDALGGNDFTPETVINQQLMGQALTMRAYGYFYLAQFFQNGYDPAEEILPIYIDPIQPNQPKSSAADVYALIVKDLTQAITLLEGYDRPTKTEVNKYVAEGLLAYTYGAMGNWAACKTASADIINNGGFTLTTADESVYSFDGDPVGGFNNINTAAGWMWGVDLTSDNGLDLVSWWGQMDRYTYSYQWAGDIKTMDEGLYNEIAADDVRKGQFYPDPASSYYLAPLYKFYDPARKIGGQRTVTTDYWYMRVAEFYLLHAEAAAQSGDEAAAKASLKFLLDQRVDDSSYVDALTGQALVDEIYLQTRIELFAEGKSYLAMKRNKATIVRGANHLSNVGVPIPYNDPRLTFEIPQSEIQNNPYIN